MAVPSSLHTLLISKETIWGIGVNPAKDAGLIVETTDATNREVINSSGLGQVETQKITTGSVNTGGSITVQLQNGRLFEFLIGYVSHTTSGSDTKHTFAIANVPESFTLESGEAAMSQFSAEASEIVYEGCLVIGGELSIVLNGVLTLKVDWAGELGTSSAAAGTVVQDTLPTFPQNLVDVKVNTVSATIIQNASIIITKTFMPVHGIKSNLMQAAFTTDLKFEFNATLGFTDVTLQELGIGGSTPPATSDPSGIEFEINADNGSAFGSGQRNIQIILENCQFSKTEKVVAIGAVTFLNLVGSGTLKTLITVDDIGSDDWITPFIETFATEDNKGLSVTAHWDTVNRRLAMDSSDNQMKSYNTKATSAALNSGGQDFQTVTVSSTETKFGTDKIIYQVSTDNSSWQKITLDTELTLITPATTLYWRVIFIGNGANATYIENLTHAYTLS